jgi:hypothetical protein
MPTSLQTSTPQTMKTAIATGFGEIDKNIHVREDWPIPCLDDFGPGFLLVRILACALAPGDVRLLSGKTDYVQLPASGHPYVTGEERIVLCESVERRVYNSIAATNLGATTLYYVHSTVSLLCLTHQTSFHYCYVLTVCVCHDLTLPIQAATVAALSWRVTPRRPNSRLETTSSHVLTSPSQWVDWPNIVLSRRVSPKNVPAASPRSNCAVYRRAARPPRYWFATTSNKEIESW